MSNAISIESRSADAQFWHDPARIEADMRRLLGLAKAVAVLGAKPQSGHDAHRIPLYLKKVGYQVVGVNPRLTRPAPFAIAHSLAEVRGPIDLVNVFRAPEHLPVHTDEILALPVRPKAVWFQLGIVCGLSAARLREAGISVIQDRCIMVEHQRLLRAH